MGVQKGGGVFQGKGASRVGRALAGFERTISELGLGVEEMREDIKKRDEEISVARREIDSLMVTIGKATTAMIGLKALTGG